jgi:Domain of unknown function (DUF5916)/Carbohydrate family 9 binding domain-like
VHPAQSPRPRTHAAALLLLLGSTASARASEVEAYVQAPGPSPTLAVQVPPIAATLTAIPIHIDGKLDESSWQKAELFDAFVQSYPHAGGSPSLRTELRVLYDADYVYVGVVARDSRPALIDRRLGRRDSAFTTDAVQLIIDSTHDHRTACSFTLSAGGVQRDGLFYDDRNFTTDWDAVWEGEAGSVDDGWVAEFAIPLSVLRFPQAPVQTWGFSVRRQIARLNEEVESVDNPRTSNATVSRLGHLTGMANLRPRIAVELAPYVAMRGVMRPQFSDPARPEPRLFDPILDLGLDLKAALTSNLTLNATINPDFGQVEADQIIQNLSTFEIQRTEKRPFFTQGLEFFKALGTATEQVPQSLFYSRRIGLTTPVLGAAKLTGNVTDDVSVGILDALVTGPWQTQDEGDPDRRWRFHPSRPFRLGPNNTLPSAPQPTTNFLAAVVHGSVGPSSRIGGSLASALPLAGRCTNEETTAERPPEECAGRGGTAAAADFDLRTEDSEYGVLGQLAGSRTVGGPPRRVLPDGTSLDRGDVGYGGYLRAGRFGGEGFRWTAGYDYSAPELDLNATGFQRTQNEQTPQLTLRYESSRRRGPFEAMSARLGGSTRWSTDGRGLRRGSSLNSALAITLPSFDQLGVEWGLDAGGYDLRELGTTGVPLQQDTATFFSIFGESNGNRALSVNGYLLAARYGRGPLDATWGATGSLSASLRPHPALEMGLQVTADRTEYPPRFIEQRADGSFLLGALRSTFFSATLRQQWLVRPRLTLQGYAQLFVSHAQYGPFFEAASDAARSPVRFSAMQPTEAEGDPEAVRAYDVALNLNLVLRWEYQRGSTFFIVFTHAQQGLPPPDGEMAPATLAPKRLLSGPADDAILLKWSYLWAS